jgi:hypothetical protein
MQRSRRHKERGVLDHLPEAEQPLVLRRLRAAWANPDPTRPPSSWGAGQRSDPQATRRRRRGPPRAGPDVDVNRLGIGGLLQTVESTNPVESMIPIVRVRATG